MSLNNQDQQYKQPESRYFPRWDVVRDVSCHLSKDEQQFQARTKDLNCTGTCISVEHLLIPDQDITLFISLAPDKEVKVSGKIVWVKPVEDQKNNIGIRFDELSPLVKDTIFNYAFEVKHDEVVKHWFDGWNE
ncbi:MAG: c-di-GMP-binding flagellar brake protein YcgR [Candidatus Omnitrophota bacterium]|jgi:c-di-GMP-binding flagellar brake protein YcgR